jgi:hypothetical protein
MNDATPFQLADEGQTHIEVNGKKQKCRYKFGLNGFTSIAQMKELVRPMPSDGRAVPDQHERGSVEYEVLVYSLDGSPARGDYPAEDPDYFRRDARVYAPTGTQHFGWTPVWADGIEWPYWSYQHGFGGDYYGRKLKAALRFEVKDQIDDCRYGMGSGMHVHHVEPHTFNVLADAWMGINSLFSKDVKLYEPHPSYSLLADRELAASWQEFHAKHADLVVMTPEEHRAIHAAKAGLE